MVKFLLKSLYYRFRSVFLNVNFKKIRIGRSVIVSNNTLLKHNVTILDYCRVFKSSINSYSYVSPFTILIDCDIGKYTSIGPGCKIGLGIHSIDKVSTSPYLYNDELFKKTNDSDFKRVIIGNDVWIGANALILGGVTIGSGAVIGAGAVVTKDIAPYAVVVGCPAKIIKFRFSEAERERIICNPWWEKPHSIIMKNKDNFNSIETFMKQNEI